MPYSKTVTGARAKFTITTENGEKRVAYAASVSYTITHGHVPVDVIGQLEPIEFAPVSYSCSMSCSNFRIPGKSPISEGFQQKLEGILEQPDLKVAIYDTGSGDAPILVMERVKFINRSGGVAARGEWTETWEFTGIVAYDEAGR